MFAKKISFIFLLSVFVVGDVVAQTTRTSLGLNGVNAHKMAVNADGSLVVVAAQGPYGFFYSTDFGASWNDTRNEEYEAGEGKSVVFVGDSLFGVTNDGLFVSTETEGVAWEAVPQPTGGPAGGPVILATDGTHLVYGTNSGGIGVLDISSNTVLEASSTPMQKLFRQSLLIHQITTSSPQLGIGRGKLRSIERLIIFPPVKLVLGQTKSQLPGLDISRVFLSAQQQKFLSLRRMPLPGTASIEVSITETTTASLLCQVALMRTRISHRLLGQHILLGTM